MQASEMKSKINVEVSMDSLNDYDKENPEMAKRLRPTFDNLAGEDRFICVNELLILLEFINEDISEEKPDKSHAYALMALFDRDNSGKLDFLEFMKLFRYFVTCSEVWSFNSYLVIKKWGLFRAPDYFLWPFGDPSIPSVPPPPFIYACHYLVNHQNKSIKILHVLLGGCTFFSIPASIKHYSLTLGN